MANIRIKLLGSVISILLLTIYVGVAYADEKSIRATGTWQDTSFIILSSRVIGDYTFLLVTGSGIVSGDFTGTFTFGGIVIIDPQGSAEYRVIDVCECTIMGKSGTVVVDERGRGSLPGGAFQANLKIIKASGDLEGLSGKGTLRGIQDQVTLLTSGTYSMNVTLD